RSPERPLRLHPSSTAFCKNDESGDAASSAIRRRVMAVSPSGAVAYRGRGGTSVEAGALISELKRRRVIRALVGYGIVAFAVLQIIEPVMHGLHWSDEVLSYVVVTLAVGFPVVVSLAWIFDVNAGRVERAGPAQGI